MGAGSCTGAGACSGLIDSIAAATCTAANACQVTPIPNCFAAIAPPCVGVYTAEQMQTEIDNASLDPLTPTPILLCSDIPTMQEIDMSGKSFEVTCATVPASDCSVDGKGATRLFSGRPTHARFRNINFHNGTAASESGGAMLVTGGQVSLTSCSFTNNTAHIGGAIFTRGARTIVNVERSVFSSNMANVSTTAWIVCVCVCVGVRCPLLCSVVNLFAYCSFFAFFLLNLQYGGGIYNSKGATAILVNSTFTDNNKAVYVRTKDWMIILPSEHFPMCVLLLKAML
jgi:predicted outer membrane repeat protein